MKLNLFERDGRKLVQGIVTEMRPGTGAATGRVLNVKIKGSVYNKEEGKEEDQEMEIAFWNSELKKLADDANNRLGVGKYVSVLCTEKDGKYSASAFKRQGIWTFPETLDEAGNVEAAEANVVIGLIVNGYDGEGRYAVSVPITVRDAEGNPVPQWVRITFFDNDKQPNLAENAKKVLAPVKSDASENIVRKTAALRCGAKNTWTSPDGQERVSYVAYAFDRIS
jgi:hypothetical protein